MYILTIALAFICIILLAVLVDTKRKLRISEMLKESAIRSDNHNGDAVDHLNIELKLIKLQTEKRLSLVDVNQAMQKDAVNAIFTKGVFTDSSFDRIVGVGYKDVCKFIFTMMRDRVYIQYSHTELSSEDYKNFMNLANRHTDKFVKYYNNELIGNPTIDNISFTHFNGKEYTFELKYIHIFNKLKQELSLLNSVESGKNLHTL